ncbi:MAG: hypothetical protein ACRDS0_30990 [Pseudonocardiaceae bacterium]
MRIELLGTVTVWPAGAVNSDGAVTGNGRVAAAELYAGKDARHP